jgi:hypothetical protein
LQEDAQKTIAVNSTVSAGVMSDQLVVFSAFTTFTPSSSHTDEEDGFTS